MLLLETRDFRDYPVAMSINLAEIQNMHVTVLCTNKLLENLTLNPSILDITIRIGVFNTVSR